MEKSVIKRVTGSKNFLLMCVLVMIILGFYTLNKNYLSVDNIRSILYSASLSGTLAVGLGMLLPSGQIDLSTGAAGMLGGVIVAFLLKSGMHWLPSLFITVAFGCCVGVFVSVLVCVFDFAAFITTLAMMTALSGIGLVITNSQNVAISNKDFLAAGSASLFGVIPLPFFIMLILYVIYGFILNYTRFGRRVIMCGGNPNAARLAGIKPKRIHTALFINNGAIACLAGALMAARMRMAAPTAVIGSEMTAITAVVLGGISFMGGGGGMGGAFIGLMLLNTFTNGLLVVGLSAYWNIVAQGILLIFALVLDFFREKSRLKALKSSKSE